MNVSVSSGDLGASVTCGSKESTACVQTSNSSNAHRSEVSVLQTTAPTIGEKHTP